MEAAPGGVSSRAGVCTYLPYSVTPARTSRSTEAVCPGAVTPLLCVAARDAGRRFRLGRAPCGRRPVNRPGPAAAPSCCSSLEPFYKQRQPGSSLPEASRALSSGCRLYAGGGPAEAVHSYRVCNQSPQNGCHLRSALYQMVPDWDFCFRDPNFCAIPIWSLPGIKRILQREIVTQDSSISYNILIWLLRAK